MRAKINHPILVISLLFISIIGNVYQYYSRPRSAARMSESDKSFVAKAVSLNAKRDKASEATVARLTTPTVINFRTKTCVQLAPAWGVVGGRTIVCFDRKTGAVSDMEEIGQ